MTPEWHAPPDQLAGFRDGTIGPVLAASVEAHLVTCTHCRTALAAVTPGDVRQERMWARIADEIDRPRRAFTPRRTWARVTLGSPPLLVATLLTVLAVVVVPLLVGQLNTRAGVTALLGLAPLAPVVAAAAAFRPSVDPAGQLAAATPMATMRLVVLRASSWSSPQFRSGSARGCPTGADHAVAGLDPAGVGAVSSRARRRPEARADPASDRPGTGLDDAGDVIRPSRGVATSRTDCPTGLSTSPRRKRHSRSLPSLPRACSCCDATPR